MDSYILKTSPHDVENGQPIRICERPFYGGAHAKAGDEVFIWFSETQGGRGLACAGQIELVEPLDKCICVTVKISNTVSHPAMAVANLEPFRHAPDGTPMSEICRKIYGHSLNKIAALSADEAYLMRQSFR